MFKKVLISALTATLVAVSMNTVALAGHDDDRYDRYYNSWFSDLTYPQFKFLRTRLLRYLRSGKQINALDDAADGSGRLVGAAINRPAFQTDADYLAALNKEFSYATPENYAKWGLLQPDNSEEWDFTVLNSMLENAEANNQLFKGHALVWHIELPGFVNEDLTAEELRVLSENHINTTLTRYAGRIYAWDVVNEAIEEDGSFRDTIWLRKFGTDYIANSFRAARAADPHAQLIYNDFNIDRINPKSNGVYNLVKGLVEDGVPIDGVGFQMHLSAEFAPSVEQIVENFERFAALGLTINVSELDVRTSKLPWDFATKLAIQQQVYHRVVDACLRVSACEAVTTWGLTDRYTWIDGTFGPDDPLQLDEQYGRKPAYFGMVDGFVGLDADDLSAKPNLVGNANFEAGTDGWFALGGEIKRDKSRRVRGQRYVTGRSILKSSNRTETYNGPAYDLKGLVGANQSYDVSALVGINRGRRDDVRITTQLQCEGEDIQYVGVAESTAKRRRWSRLDGQFTTPDCNLETATLYVEGPKAGVSLYVDNVSVRPQQLVPAPRDDLGENLLTNGDFEAGFDTWSGYAAGSAQLSTEETFNGTGAGLAFERANTFDGISTELLGIVEPGKKYEFSGFAKIAAANSDRVQATLFANCAAGPEFLFISSVQASNQGWVYLTGSLTIPDCDASNYTFYFEGPQPGVNFLVDDASVREVLDVTPVTTIIDSKFETDTEGWYGFGTAFLQTTDTVAYEGNQSLLVTNRGQTFEGPAFNITNSVVAGATYNLNAFTRIQGATTDDVRATVVAECSDATSPQFLGIASVTGNDSDWIQISGAVTIPNCTLTQVQIYFEGPAAGVDILVDAVTLVGESGAGADNLATNGDFEGADFSPWGATAGETILLVTDPVFEGTQAIAATNRTETFEGPGIDLGGITQPGTTYSIKAQARVANAAAANVRVTVRTVCEDDSQVFLGAGSVDTTDSSWGEINGSVIMPACTAKVQRFYFEGPAAGVDIFIDNVVITAQ